MGNIVRLDVVQDFFECEFYYIFGDFVYVVVDFYFFDVVIYYVYCVFCQEVDFFFCKLFLVQVVKEMIKEVFY